MKFNCGPSALEQDRLTELECYHRNEAVKRGEGWRSWFAWYPVRIAEDDCRWLERVDRRRCGWFVDLGGNLSALVTEYRVKGADGA